MHARGFWRPAPATLFTAGWAAAMIACFTIGQAQAQFVNPAPPPPPPTFNPSSPYTVAPTPETPVSPGTPSGLPGSPSELNESAPAPVSQPEISTAAKAKPTLSRARGRHHGHLRRRAGRRRRHGRAYAVRAIGPSYFPGLGTFYPPYLDPCHFSRVWNGYWVGSWTYTCS